MTAPTPTESRLRSLLTSLGSVLFAVVWLSLLAASANGSCHARLHPEDPSAEMFPKFIYYGFEGVLADHHECDMPGCRSHAAKAVGEDARGQVVYLCAPCLRKVNKIGEARERRQGEY